MNVTSRSRTRGFSLALGSLIAAVALAACGGSAAPAASTAASKAPAPSKAPAASSAPPASSAAPAPASQPASAAASSPATKPSAGAGGAEHVKVAITSGSLTGAGVYIALERGYFKQVGLDVEIVPFPGGAQMISSIAASQVDVADTDTGAGVFNAISRNLPMRFVADGSRCDAKRCGTSFVVRKDIMDAGKFKDLKDLKGLKVNNFTTGSTLYQFLARMLDKAGLKPSDLKEASIPGFADVMTAFGNKGIDASWMIEPLTTAGVAKGLFERYKTATELFGPWQNTVIVYAPNFATQHQQAGQKFMVGYVRGLRDYLDAMDSGKDYDAIIGILTKDSSLKDAALYKKVGLPGFDANGEVLIEAVKSAQQWYVEHGDVKTPVDLDKVYDPSFLQHAWSVAGKR
ncbi:MAG: ABC transporter substrate-binding protein [Chloroflexota bacterium]|nr:ABC transporter substrate-binding protein [Chloroflexota bacterium]